MLETLSEIPKLIKTVVDSTCGPEADSWTIEVATTLGSSALARQFVNEVKAHTSGPLVALLRPDEIPNRRAYINELHRQWSENSDVPAASNYENDHEALSQLLARVPTDRPVIQIIDRFHRAITGLGDWVLGNLRTAEAEQKIRSVVLTPYNIWDLKDRWSEEGHILTVSNYGDQHLTEQVSLLSPDECVSALELKGYPRHVAQFVVETTGGYPEVVEAMGKVWKGSPQLTPDVRNEMVQVAERVLVRLVKNMDSPNQTDYRKSLVKIHLNDDTDDAIAELTDHPWSRILLEDQSLRAAALSSAAVAEEARQMRGSDNSLLNRAKFLYSHKQYAAADLLLARIVNTESRRTLDLCRNTKLMQRCQELDPPGNARAWQAIHRAASKTISEELKEPYKMIAEAAKLLANAAKTANSNHNDRLIDVLAGLFGKSNADPGFAKGMLLLSLSRAIDVKGHVSALDSAIAIPEQALRLWAFWKLGINYYSAPDNCDDSWRDADEFWKTKLRRAERLAPTAPGNPFISLPAFVAFCATRCEEARSTGLDGLQLVSSLNFIMSIRNARAHSVCSARPEQREKFFEIADCWVDAATKACPTKVPEGLQLIIDGIPL